MPGASISIPRPIAAQRRQARARSGSRRAGRSGPGSTRRPQGCLVTLDVLKQRGALFRNIVDVGTGTGLLAFAAMHLWPRAYATASDIDPASIEVTADNADLNGVALGHSKGQLALAVASGLDHPLILRRAPYDLIVANILAGPLIALAPAIAAALEPGGPWCWRGYSTSRPWRWREPIDARDCSSPGGRRSATGRPCGCASGSGPGGDGQCETMGRRQRRPGSGVGETHSSPPPPPPCGEN